MGNHTRQGFSLIELAIVLAIIGLLIGGVMGAQNMIQNSRLRKVTEEISQYETALESFRTRFRAWPGDMLNATTYWGSIGGTGSDSVCQNLPTPVGSTATCNGNGDRTLSSSSGVATAEMARFWQHLANAELITGEYNGVYGMVIGTNVPGSAFASNVYYRTNYSAAYAGSTSSFAYSGGNQILIHSTNAGGAGTLPFTPEEAYYIDGKRDDGYPATGTITSYKGTAAIPCSTTAGQAVSADVSSAYNLTNKSKDCLLYRLNFSS